MSLTANEEARILNIEKTLNDVQIAITNLASQQQLRQLVTLKQKEINDLTARVVTLESEVNSLIRGR